MALRRSEAVIGDSLDLRIEFRYDDSGALFDPYSISKVEILDAESEAILETITSITRLSLGVYQVITSAGWNTTSRAINDKWYYKKVSTSVEETAIEDCFIFSTTPPVPVTGLPTATEIRNFLEGYCIGTSVVSDSWIEDTRDNEVLTYVNNFCRTNVLIEQEVTEYYSGTGRETLFLNRRNVSSITRIELVYGEDITGSINLGSVILLGGKGMLKLKSGISEFIFQKYFPKGDRNIKITYKYGGTLNADVRRAMIMLTALLILTLIEGRTGGGSLAVQGFSRDYGSMGKYTNIRKSLSKRAHAILRRYSTAVVGA